MGGGEEDAGVAGLGVALAGGEVAEARGDVVGGGMAEELSAGVGSVLVGAEGASGGEAAVGQGADDASAVAGASVAAWVDQCGLRPDTPPPSRSHHRTA